MSQNRLWIRRNTVFVDSTQVAPPTVLEVCRGSGFFGGFEVIAEFPVEDLAIAEAMVKLGNEEGT